MTCWRNGALGEKKKMLDWESQARSSTTDVWTIRIGMCLIHTCSPSFHETKTGGFPSLKLPYLNNMHTKVSKVEYFKLPPV